MPLASLGIHSADSEVAIVVGSREVESIAAEVKIASGILEFHLVELILPIRFPEQQETTSTTTGSGNCGAVRMQSNAPSDSAKFGLRKVFDLLLSVFPIKYDNRRIANSSERVRDIGDSATC
jgi:hypothetical protein